MASSIATIANDGVLVPPRVVLGTYDPEGVFRPRETPASKRVLSKDAARQIGAMLEGVVEKGTGTRASVPGYRIAGKSGTAQKAVAGGGYSEKDFFASFGGFGPVDSPRVAGLVLLDSPRGKRHQGGYVAAPVFGRIMAEALYHLRVPPQRVEPSPALKADGRMPPPSKAERSDRALTTDGTLPDVRGMSLRDATAALSFYGCRVKVSGTGYVAAQQPAAGARPTAGAVCHLRLSARAVASGRRAG
jgi:membrane peptidoglycan carboxypeptidase